MGDDEAAGAAERAAATSGAGSAVRGSLWTMGGYLAANVLRLGGNLVLTRLLFPAVFGEMALVFIFIQGLQMFSDVGTGPAIVQSDRGDRPRFLDTAWTIQCIRGGALWLASCAIAFPAAAFYGQPSLRWLIPGAGLTALLAGFESTSVHTVQRQLRLERLTLLDLAGQGVTIAGSVLLAAVDRAVFGPDHASAGWAIVVGNLAGSSTRLVLSHVFLPGHRNALLLDREEARHLFAFGRWIFVSTLLTFLAGQLDRLMLGKMIPIALFGVYNIAFQFATIPTLAISKLVHAVLFPAFSRSLGRPDFRELVARGRWPLLLGGAAAVSVLGASAPSLVRVLYDARYVEAGWILQYLAAAAWFQILEYTNVAALLATGRVRWMAAASAVKVAGMVAVIPLGFRLGGFQGALVGVVASDLLKYVATVSGTAIAVGGARGFVRDVPLTVGIVGTAAAGLAAGSWAIERGAGSVAALGASAAAAGLPWAMAGLWYLRRFRSERAARAA